MIQGAAYFQRDFVAMESSLSQDTGIKLRSTEDGIHLEGSILWLDSKKTGDISFLSNSQCAKSTVDTRVIATEETTKILEAFRKKPKALVCQYNRPFAIGPLNMELLPSGAGLGGASLWVETNQKKILYAPHLQPMNSEICHHMQLRPADILILNAQAPYSSEVEYSRKKEKDRLLHKVIELIENGQSPIIYCDPFVTGPELCHLLGSHGIQIDLHSKISKVLKVYESYGSHIEKHDSSASAQKAKVSLHPTPQGLKKMRITLPNRPIISVIDDPNTSIDDGLFKKIEDRFYIPSTCEGRELKAIINKVNPQEIYIFGPYAKEYVGQLKSAAPSVKALFPKHLPSLF